MHENKGSVPILLDNEPGGIQARKRLSFKFEAKAAGLKTPALRLSQQRRYRMPLVL
jgi:hypothetical protein